MRLHSVHPGDGGLYQWNEFVLEAYGAVRESFPQWRASGGPRLDPLVEEIRLTRARFKLCLSWCKAHEEELRGQSLETKLAGGETNSLWFGLRAMTPHLPTLPLGVEHSALQIHPKLFVGR